VRPGEAGLTVVELVVTMAILLLFSSVAFEFLTSANRTAVRTTNDVQAENDVRLALRQMTGDLRAADPISTTYPVSGTCASGAAYPAGFAKCVSFTIVHNSTAGLNCPKTVVTYGLVGGVIKTDRVTYDGSCSATSTTTGKTVISNVVNPSGVPLFRFFDSTGNQITTTTSTSPYVTVASVMITLVEQYQSGAPTISVSSSAALRNNRA
jgi:type II secretory pathway pseudopilin PulG